MRATGTQVASTFSVGLGFAAIYRNKALNGKAHYTSLHGKVRAAGGIHGRGAVAARVMPGVPRAERLPGAPRQ